MAAALKVGVAGLGTVGASVIKILDERRDALTASSGRPIQVTAVSARERGKDRGVDLNNIKWHDDPLTLAADANVDLVVELIGGAEGKARATVETALKNGKPVVTANKALLAAHGLALAALAEEKNVSLAFEAAVAGGIPIIKTLREALPGSRLDRVSGILNGTCNFILTRMEEDGLSFGEALALAQKLGYAEADPTFDIGGFDAAHKLAILTSLAFGTQIDADAIYVEGIQSISPLDLATAEELGYRIKLLGVATRTEAGIEQRVHPTMVPKSAPLAQVMGVTNAVQISGSASDITLVGPGAGGAATASAVIADIVDVARGASRLPFGVPVKELQKLERAAIQTHKGGYYIRLDVVDRPGTAAAIATRMAEQEISLESILQRKPRDKKLAEAIENKTQTVPLVLITHATSESAVRKALDDVLADGHIHGSPQVIRIEKEH
ncbi:homoserine dehydrogenase [Terrihabitans soli]|uniref:Homoserine dehydrogenase n=1 Tax=Terrihabitans soli TaxID=708113 RepID=A0A6S6QWJ7_9HYPH|nr:homoserine dehydrogenase [Terrihabitans soli]BCJ90898.1 homoserine dehydrogenase [Terrihabitans soli]